MKKNNIKKSLFPKIKTILNPYQKIIEQAKIITLLERQDKLHWEARVSSKIRDNNYSKRLQEKQTEIARLKSKLNKFNN